jgi:anti-sigma factor RsiW
MACGEWKVKLMDFILEELPRNEAQELDRHVAQCAPCAAALAELKNLSGAMRQHFVDREMPAHLVLIPERAPSTRLGFLASSWGAAALGGALAAVFLFGIFFGGLLGSGRDRSRHEPAANIALSRAEFEAMVIREVSEKLAQQRTEFQLENARLSESLRQEQVRSLSRLTQHMEYLQSANNLMWEEAQNQGALVQMIARNSMGEAKPPALKQE